MKPIHRFAPSLLLLAAACSPSSGGDGDDTTARAEGAAASGTTTAGDNSWSAQALDTGVDLSHLRQGAGAAGFPSDPIPAVTGEQPVALPASGPPGRIELAADDEETAHDFGDVLEGDSRTHVFRLKSSGNDPLIIQRLKPSCGCTAAEVDLLAADGSKSTYVWGEAIEPGTMLEVPTTINSAGRNGKMRTNVSIYSNDPASPYRLEVEADVVPVLVVEPLLLDFGKMTSSDRKEGTITVKTEVLDPFFLTLDADQVLSPLTVDVTPVDPDASGKAKVWELHVVLGPQTPEGIRRYPLKLITDVAAPTADDGHGHDHGPQPVGAAFRTAQANVQATVSGMIVANPNFVSLGLVAPGTRVDRSVRIESLDPEFKLSETMPIEVVSFTGEEFPYAEFFSFVVEPIAGQEGKAVDLTISLSGMPEDFQGSFGGSVRLKIAHPNKDLLEVRFSGVSRPGLPNQVQASPIGTGGGGTDGGGTGGGSDG